MSTLTARRATLTAFVRLSGLFVPFSSRSETDFTASRFDIRRLLGWGGMGVVYEAFDRQRRSRVALKTLRSMDAAGLLRFKNEFRSLVDLAHPNLVRLGELLEENGQLFFTMELVSGVPFVEYVRGDEPSAERVSHERASQPAARRDDLDTVVRPAHRPGPDEAVLPLEPGVLHEGRLRACLVQLAHGLGALHATGRVHRDIKPSNVLVAKDGRLVILDFGLVTETSAEEEEHVVGTAHFMAPEQARGKAVGPAADWYAVGVMLYLAMTGVLPFDVASDAVTSVKQAATPLPPSATVPGLPADLEALVMGLLRVDPAERATGEDVLRALGVEGAPISTVSSLATPAFVGRHRELAELSRAFDDALRGEARALFIEGESGVGKTTLARKFIGRLAPAALVLAARCYERESVPYKAVDGIIDRVGPHLSKLPPEEALALLPRDIGLAATVFPVLAIADSVAKRAVPSPATSGQPLGDSALVLDLLDAREPRPGGEPSPTPPPASLRSEPPPPSELRRTPEMEPAELRQRVFAAMRQLFANLARERPVILAIDDLQWADADSLALLSEILRPDTELERSARAAGAPILLVATVRTGTEVSAAAPIRLAIPRELVRTLHLTRMPPDEARDLVGALLRTLAAPGPLEGGLDIAALLSEGRGHPLFLDALVRHRVAHAGATGPLRLDDALWGRMQALPPRARMLLTVVSVAGGPVARRVAQHALTAEPEEVDRLVASLRAEHFARTTGSASEEAFEPYHDRIREMVASRLSLEERRGWHARLALALETMGSGELEELSVHWNGAGDSGRAADYAARAGDEATAAFAFDRAARLYRTALGLLPQTASERPSLYLRLGDAHSNGGRGHEAAEAYVAASALYPEASSLELRRRAAENLLRSGYIDEGMQHLRAVLGAVGLELPATPSSTLTALLFRRAELRLRGLKFVERHPDKIPAAELRRVDVCWSAAKGLGMVDTIRGSYFQVRALLFALAAGDPYRVSRSLSLELGFVATVGASSRPRLNELLHAAETAATRSRHPHALALIPALQGVALFLEGDFHEALPLLITGEHLLRTRCVGVSWETGSTLTFLLWSLWWAGDYRTFCGRAPAIIREAEERGDRYLATNLCSGYVNAAWLVADDPQTAEARAASAIGPWGRGGSHLQHFHDMVARVHIDLYRGDGAAAYRRIDAAWKALDDSMSLRIQVVRVTSEYLRGAAAIAAAENEVDPAALLSVALRAARRLEGERAAWAAPLGALLRAGARARDGERGTSVTSLLEEAARGASACGMAGYAAAARRALGLVRGDSDGQAMVAAADAELGARGVKSPARFAGMLAPGFEG